MPAVVDIVSRKIVKTASLGCWPDMVAISTDGDDLFVTIGGENKLVKLSASDLSVEGVAGTGDEPHGVAYRP